MNDSVDSFRVVSQDDYGKPVRCAGCPREVKRVVVLLLAPGRALEAWTSAADGEEPWLGLCAHCLLGMARALARAEGKL